MAELPKGMIFHYHSDDGIKIKVDAIPLVRCGECKYKPHWDEQVSEEDRDGFDIIFPVEYKCPCQCEDEWYSWIPDDDWFCADGEREVQE